LREMELSPEDVTASAAEAGSVGVNGVWSNASWMRVNEVKDE